VERLQTRGIRPKTPYDLGSPWADFRLPSTKELAGREISLALDEGSTLDLAFEADTLGWSWKRSDSTVEELRDTGYDAVASRDGVYFVQLLHDDQETATSIVLNLGSGGAVLVQNRLVHGQERSDLQQDLYAGCVAGSGAALPQLSAELVGRRAYAEYADGHTAEHVYLNPRRFVWQGLGKFDYSGSECDHSTTWKIDDGLFLLTWVEEWQAVSAALLMDFTALRNVGVLFGQDDNGLVHTLCGARLKVLGETSYPEGYEPAGVAGPSERR
jgi:MoaF C-terminal domain/MoaF N-terminal domain